MAVFAADMEAGFYFLILPSCQPVLSMGRMADADYEFSWRKINGFKIMRIHQTDGAFVDCFLRDCVPRLYCMTDAEGAPNDTDSTVERKAFPDLSHVKTSCNPLRTPKKLHGCANTVTTLPVSSQPKEEASESEGPPALAESSSEEEV